MQALVDAAISAAVATGLPPITEKAEVSLVFATDGAIRILNARYRQQDRATNVLSFPAAQLNPARFGPLLGDIVLACETIEREAKEQGVAIADHLTHLIVHGFLHLLGYDHEIESEALTMERLEIAILSRLGIADPYAGSVA